MSESHDVHEGAVLRIAVEHGRSEVMEIVKVEDGRVIFRRPGLRGGGRWWLPYEFVRRNSDLVAEPKL